MERVFIRPQDDGDRVLAALAYLFAPLPSLVILVTDMKRKRFLRYHAYQALVLGVGLVALYAALVASVFGLCLVPLLFAAQLRWAYLAYTRGAFTIRFATRLAARLFGDFPA